MELDTQQLAQHIVDDLYAKGHGKDVTIRRLIQILGFTTQEADDVFNRCAYATSSAFNANPVDLPDADCANCKFMELPHEDAHCYMFEVKPGDQCGQFDPKK